RNPTEIVIMNTSAAAKRTQKLLRIFIIVTYSYPGVIFNRCEMGYNTANYYHLTINMKFLNDLIAVPFLFSIDKNRKPSKSG
ncbi:MAG: hypothetical protein M1327_04280, partial [Candidatus Thermoplasmatota archaeon]|nr:hypothetical protein [Candidatus Thermoplasmatota archaeon]